MAKRADFGGGRQHPSALSAGRFFLVAMLLAMSATGCTTCRFPRLDPTGERIFATADAPAPGAIPVPGAAAITTPSSAAGTVPAFPGLPGAPTPGVANVPALPPVAPAGAGILGAPVPIGAAVGPQPGLSLSPRQIVAPVGSEVVLIAGVWGAQGYLLTRERIEWTINASEPGQFVAVGNGGILDLGYLHHLPKKVANTYAVSMTFVRPQRLDRGTPTPYDDLNVHTGQTWVSVSSPSEGTSHVTAFAPGVVAWDRRQQTSTIYWVDAQWAFPAPTVNPVGARHAFTTSLTRQSDGSPLAGYIVRYEVAGGPAAGFAPDGAPAVEVATNELGQATAEIFQTQPAPGTNQVNIQVIRPATIGGGTRRVELGASSVMATWTSSQLTVRTTGPAQAEVGAVATYRIEVSNPGGIPARDVVLTDAATPGMAFVNSNPVANSSPSAQEWRLGEIGSQQTTVVEVNYRVQQPGTIEYCATATSGDGLSSRGCATTVVTPPAAPAVPAVPAAPANQVTVNITGPDTAAVGDQVQFEIVIANEGSTPAAGLLITDRFDTGLEHAVSRSPIERDLPELAPGASQKVNVTFHVTRPGRLCQQVGVSGPGIRVGTQKCLNVPPPAGAAPPPATPPAQPPAVPPATGATSPLLSVRKTGPARRQVGETAEFTIVITNTGRQPLQNVRVADNYETTLEPTAATRGWEPSGGALVWSYPTLEAGQTIELQVHCKCLSEAIRSCNRVTVTADGGQSLADEACLEIAGNQAGAPAAAAPSTPALPANPVAPPITPGSLSLSVADDIDPARVGSDVIYQIVLTNNSNQPDRQVLVTAQLPQGVTLQNVRLAGTARATISGRTLRFPPIAELRANETVTYEVRVRVDQPGSATVTADVTSLRQPSPVTAQTSTEVLP